MCYRKVTSIAHRNAPEAVAAAPRGLRMDGVSLTKVKGFGERSGYGWRIALVRVPLHNFFRFRAQNANRN